MVVKGFDHLGDLIDLHSKEERKKVYKLDVCSGCNKEIAEDEDTKGIIVPYTDHDEYIVLCRKCSGISKYYM